MPFPKGEQGLREEIKRIFCEVILPRRTVPEVARKIGVGKGDEILSRALIQARERIGEIIDHMPVINTQALDLRVPGPEFLEVLLQMEYLYFNSLFGEKGTLKYLKKIREPESRTLLNMLNSYGFHRPEDLRPEEGVISSGSGDQEGTKALAMMKAVLENNSGGNR